MNESKSPTDQIITKTCDNCGRKYETMQEDDGDLCDLCWNDLIHDAETRYDND